MSPVIVLQQGVQEETGEWENEGQSISSNVCLELVVSAKPLGSENVPNRLAVRGKSLLELMEQTILMLSGF